MTPISPEECRWPRVRWQIVIFAISALVFLYLTGQLAAPFLAGDDWPFLLPASQQGGTALPWLNTLAEGRWINYLWYFVSVHLTARIGNSLFTAAYIALTCAIAAAVANRRLYLLIALALFFSPMFAELSLWPNSLLSAVALCTIATLLIAWRGDRRRVALPTLFAATLALVMAYPPLASIVLLCAAFRQKKPTIASNAVLAIVFLVAFAAGVLSAYALNAQFHGYFGVKVAAWRHPHPLRSVADLVVNLKLAAANWHRIAQRFLLPIVCIGVASVRVVLKDQTRARGLAVIFALVISWCVAIGITVIAGATDPARSVPWLWVAACLLCSLAAIERRVGALPYLGGSLLLVLAVSGGLFFWHHYRHYRPIVTYIEQLGRVVQRNPATVTGPSVVITGDFSRVPTVSGLAGTDWPDPDLKWILWKQFGVVAQRCDYKICALTEKYVSTHHDKYPTILRLNNETILVLNAHPAEEILRDYPSAQMQARLGLQYPIFMQYGHYSARVTPFFPGFSATPASVALPARSGKYTLRGPQACAYPVAYTLSTPDGKQLAAGQYRAPGTITINQSALRTGYTLLSLSMAKGAKNNYNCNIVVTASPTADGAVKAGQLLPQARAIPSTHPSGHR